MKPTLFFLVLLLFFTACQPTADSPQQSKLEVDKKVSSDQHQSKQVATKETEEENEYRNQNWRPSEGAYFFSTVYTWSYQNELLPVDDPHRKGTFAVYVDPPTGTMLITKNDAKYTDEMTEWIIIHPEGDYTTAFIDEHGKPRIIKTNTADFPNHTFKLSHQAGDFKKYLKQLAGEKQFGQNMYGWQTVKGIPYQMTFEQTRDTAELHLLEMRNSVRGLYLVGQTNQDLKFPINLNFGYLLSENQLVLSEMIDFNGKKVSFELISITPTEYFINTVTFLQNH